MLVKLFLESKSSVKITCRCYAAAINQFRVFVRPDIEHTEPKEALKFITRLEQGGAAWATIRNRVGALTAFFDFLEAIGERSGNPFRCIRGLIPKRQRCQVRPTAALSVSIIRAMLKAPAKNTKSGIRDKALLAALFGGALRPSEAAALKVSDVQVTQGGNIVLRLAKTKAGIVQYQILSNRFAETIVELVSQRKSEGATNCDPLFINYNRHGGRICARTIARMFSHYAAECGVHAAPHAARAAAITQLLRAGASVIDVKRFSRHARLDSLEAYDKRDKVANI